jgi:hypothetical protein
MAGDQLQKDVQNWLSPPDPSTNHDIASGAYQSETAAWFFQGTMFATWKATGSLLWIHGKRMLYSPLASVHHPYTFLLS